MKVILQCANGCSTQLLFSYKEKVAKWYKFLLSFLVCLWFLCWLITITCDTTFSWHKNLPFSWPPSCKHLSNRLNSKIRKHIVYNNVIDQKWIGLMCWLPRNQRPCGWIKVGVICNDGIEPRGWNTLLLLKLLLKNQLIQKHTIEC